LLRGKEAVRASLRRNSASRPSSGRVVFRFIAPFFAPSS
jgi:hypothetical protein